MEIKTRRQAAESGESKYYTGRPCSKGHDGPRYVASGICCKCNSEGVKRYNSKVALLKNNKLAGAFVYDLHLDDHAALLAYAQALDLQRGRTPRVPAKAKHAAGAGASLEDVARFRAQALGEIDKLTPDHRPAYVPKEFDE